VVEYGKLLVMVQLSGSMFNREDRVSAKMRAYEPRHVDFFVTR